MKLSHDSFLKLCKNPLGTWKSLLFYGNSEFWVQSKIDYFLQNGLELKNHHPRLISQELILENRNFLSDLFFTKDFFSGPELIILTQVTDKIVPLIEDLFQGKSIPFLIIRARDYLKPSSRLRKLYEGNYDLASIPCYELASIELEREIVSFFTQNQKKISPALTRQLGNFFHASPDTLKTELEKILTFMGSKEEIDLKDLKNLVSLSNSADVIDLVSAFLDRDKKKVINCIENLDETISYISILRVLAASLARLHYIKCKLNTGNSLEESIKALTPPLAFNEQGAFKKRLSLWSQQQLEDSLKKTSEREIFIKLNSKAAKEILEFSLLETLISV
jgi:DNA polymerase-3 subunit delta